MGVLIAPFASNSVRKPDATCGTLSAVITRGVMYIVADRWQSDGAAFAGLMQIQRVLILCGSLEQGRDGVGDYCRQLALAFRGFGIECTLVALNDRFVIGHEVQEAIQSGLPVIRLPESLPIATKGQRLARLIADWKPDWVSLHFVCYSFNRKGVAFREPFWLPPLLRGQRLHLMLHELWFGLDQKVSLKYQYFGALQRYFVLKFIRRIGATAVDTSNHFYARLLEKYKIASEILPMFGSIPVTSDDGGSWLSDIVREKAGPDFADCRDRYAIYGLFGAIVPEWPAEKLFVRLSAFGNRAGHRTIVMSAGHPGQHAPRLLASWRRQFPEIVFIELGPLRPVAVSWFMNSADVGLTSHPLFVLGKSSSVAAMLEHDLPVIASWGDIAPELAVVAPDLDRLIWRADDHLEEKLGRLRGGRSRRTDACASAARALIDRWSRPPA